MKKKLMKRMARMERKQNRILAELMMIRCRMSEKESPFPIRVRDIALKLEEESREQQKMIVNYFKA